jgi:hypothetical protein
MYFASKPEDKIISEVDKFKSQYVVEHPFHLVKNSYLVITNVAKDPSIQDPFIQGGTYCNSWELNDV